VTTLLLLFALAFLVAVDVRITAPVLPSISESLAASPGTIGLAVTSYSLAYGSGQLLYGPLSDRHGRMEVVRLAALGFGLCTVVSALSGTAWQFIAVRLVVGLFAGSVIPLTLVHIGDTYAYAERQAVLGRFSVVTSAAMALSAGVGGTVAHFVSWRAMLVGYGALALLPALAMFRAAPTRPARPPGADGTRVSFKALLVERRARRVYLAVFFEGFFLWGAVTYLGAFAVERLAADQLAVGLLMSLFGIGTMIGGGLLGRARRWLSENGLARGGGLVMGLALLGLLPRGPWPAFAVAMLALGLGFVALHTTLQLRGTEINPAARGKAFSLFAFSLFAGSATGTALLGLLVDRGWHEATLALAGIGLIVVGAFAAWGRRPAAG
jgi:predicted MFS family arabinose efflux permease